jgi:hypothetical protein
MRQVRHGLHVVNELAGSGARMVIVLKPPVMVFIYLHDLWVLPVDVRVHRELRQFPMLRGLYCNWISLDKLTAFIKFSL